MAKPHILLVDDEKDTLLITKQYLTQQGYSVTTASSSATAKRYLQRDTYSAIVLDLRLVNPGDKHDFSGLDLATEIAQSNTVPILLSTQYPTFDVAVKALSGHLHRSPLVADIVLKEKGLEALLASLENILIPKRVFLSYVREDEYKVKRLYSKLEKAGFVPWMDTRDIRKGTKWKIAIERAMDETDFFVICLSNNSLGKRGYFQLEINKAIDACKQKLDDDIFLIPLRLDPSDIQSDTLKRYQWVNYYEAGGINQLLEALRSGGRRYIFSE